MSRTAARREELREALEELYERYNDRSLASPDPLSHLYRYSDPADREIAGLIASALAFGTVRQIGRSIEGALGAMGSSPRRYLGDSPQRSIRSDLSRFKHRWITGDDLASLLICAQRAVAEYGSLEACFLSGFDDGHRDIVTALELFVDRLTGEAVFSCTGIFPSPCRSSACKRPNLFLRWMVRRDAVDPGGWRGVPTAKLIVPLDIHMHRIALALGFTRRRRPDIKAAREVTDAFREIAPHDPVKYDFALTRLGIRRDGDRQRFIERLGIAESLYR
jgi:uncharacterized protein (TIGR02757 family)